LKKELKIKHY